MVYTETRYSSAVNHRINNPGFVGKMLWQPIANGLVEHAAKHKGLVRYFINRSLIRAHERHVNESQTGHLLPRNLIALGFLSAVEFLPVISDMGDFIIHEVENLHNPARLDNTSKNWERAGAVIPFVPSILVLTTRAAIQDAYIRAVNNSNSK